MHPASTQPLTMITASDAQSERNRIARCAFNNPYTSNGLLLKLCRVCVFDPIDCVDNLLHPLVGSHRIYLPLVRLSRINLTHGTRRLFSRHSLTSLHVESTLYSFMLLAIVTVFLPRSF